MSRRLVRPSTAKRFREDTEGPSKGLEYWGRVATAAGSRQVRGPAENSTRARGRKEQNIQTGLQARAGLFTKWADAMISQYEPAGFVAEGPVMSARRGGKNDSRALQFLTPGHPPRRAAWLHGNRGRGGARPREQGRSRNPNKPSNCSSTARADRALGACGKRRRRRLCGIVSYEAGIPGGASAALKSKGLPGRIGEGRRWSGVASDACAAGEWEGRHGRRRACSSGLRPNRN